MWYQKLWAVRGMILKNISNQSKVRRKIKATMWLLIGVMPSVLFPILFPFFVLWCELHGLYLAVWISMVAWLNPITENNICSLGNNRNQNDPLFLKHDFWLLSSLSNLMKTKMQFWLLIFTVFLLSPMRLHPVTSGDVNASSPEVARSQFRWNIKRCSYSCSDIGSLTCWVWSQS